MDQNKTERSNILVLQITFMGAGNGYKLKVKSRSELTAYKDRVVGNRISLLHPIDIAHTNVTVLFSGPATCLRLIPSPPCRFLARGKGRVDINREKYFVMKSVK